MAEFAVLHRNELSGALGGLTRVRRFQQDDAHIFCRHDQIAAEVAGVLDLLKHTYGIFGFTFDLTLSTRPDNFLGELSQWDQAELALAECLDSLGTEWSINEADGAFYGPKIDIQLCDALKRKHQCATIQLDFQNPINFDLKYKADDGSFQRPCVVHRAIFGSVERFISILTEHCGGKWPFFISPRQVMVIPVSEVNFEYAAKVHKTLADAGFYADVNLSKNQFPKKVFEAQKAQYNYFAVVGDEEMKNGTINLRVRGQTKGLGEKTVADFVQFLKDEVAQRK
jgi:threonyl-tRNA synthetase